MDNIKADECRDSLIKLIRQNKNDNNLPQVLRDSMIAVYDTINRENACELYNKFYKEIQREFLNRRITEIAYYRNRTLKISGGFFGTSILLFVISLGVKSIFPQYKYVHYGIIGVSVCTYLIGFLHLCLL